MSSKAKAQIAGIYGLGRVPGFLGRELVVPMVPLLKGPTTADRFFRELGGTRDLFWSLIGASVAFNPMLPRGPSQMVIPPITIKFESKRFRSCEEAGNHLILLKSEKRRIAEAIPGSADTKLLNERKEKIGPGEFRFKADVFVALSLRKASILFPHWTWKAMSKSDHEALRKFNLNLLVHELGHFIVTGQILAYAKKSFEGFGTTPSQAETEARLLIRDHFRTLKNDDDTIGDDYDTHTSHGMKQSEGPDNTFNTEGRNNIPFPGGEDAILRCGA
jgi:hypothetical protein